MAKKLFTETVEVTIVSISELISLLELTGDFISLEVPGVVVNNKKRILRISMRQACNSPVLSDEKEVHGSSPGNSSAQG